MKTIRPRLAATVAVAPALLAALLAIVIGLAVPLVSPLLIALFLGALLANTPAVEHSLMSGQARTTKILLRLGVVLLGLKLPIADILGIGVSGVVIVVLTVVVTYGATVMIGDQMGLDRGFVTLLAAGFSICGAAAIAAVDDAVRAQRRFVALAVALVTLFGSAMILLLPWLASLLGLSEHQAAIWAGASIHEVAQVVAAASLVGTGALAVATTVKLGRVVLLAPMYVVATRRGEKSSDRRTPLVPWFVVGFGVAVAARSTGILAPGALEVTDVATTILLAAGMFGLGLGIRIKELWPIPVHALLLATVSTLVAAGTSLALVLFLI